MPMEIKKNIVDESDETESIEVHGSEEAEKYL